MNIGTSDGSMRPRTWDSSHRPRSEGGADAGRRSGQSRRAVPAGGLFLVMLRLRRSVCLSRRRGGLFFQRYVLPLCNIATRPTMNSASRRAALTHTVNGQSGIDLPGVMLAAFPVLVERSRSAALDSGRQDRRLSSSAKMCCASAAGWAWTESGSTSRPTNCRLHR